MTSRGALCTTEMGTGVIFYEEIADDIVQTWDLFDTLFAERLRIRVYPTQLLFRYPLQSFLFDPDRPYDLPISAIRPDGVILHPSPPRHPPVPPPFGPSSSHYSLGPDYIEVPMIPPRSYYSPVRDPPMDLVPVRVEPRSPPPAPIDTGVIGEPYDPLYDLAGFIDEYYRRPPEAVPAPMEADPVEDPMDTDDDEDGLADTDTGEDEDPEEVGQSEDSEDTRSDEHSVVSTDTCESRA
ncbi:hypothetical protein PIB30_080164 [Stylosanthes scabra]|uniref:Uncharacterized protein n=1 Tax=Stylosanthes scabra TaxID=79078 RepID=A0ABU6SSM9_9FABA|nr:hypothetical protein [Stylosanthes scabra]